MKDHETPEAIEARASQEDPIVMYLIVHESLGMSTGKTAAQCAHASQMLTLEYFDLKDKMRMLMKNNEPIPPLLARKISIFGEWLQGSFRKVVLRSSDKEFDKVKKEFADYHILVVDAGLTEIPSGSETVIGLWPMRKSQRPKTIQRLQVLK